MTSSEPDVLVIGAGVSGLTTAVCLAEAGARVQICSANPPRSDESRPVQPHQFRIRAHALPCLRGVRAGGYGSDSAAGECPFQVAGLGLLEVPAGCLLGRVMPTAKRRQIAFAGAAALVVGDRVVVIAAPGGPPAARKRARPIAVLDQVPQDG